MRRRKYLHAGALALTGGLFGGCQSSSPEGSVVETVEFINVATEQQTFSATLISTDDETVFDETITVPGKPGNVFARRTVSTVPDERIIEVTAELNGQSMTRAVPDDLPPRLASIQCNPQRDLGIAIYDCSECSTETATSTEP